MKTNTRNKIINILKYGKEWTIDKHYLKNKRAGLCIWIGNGTYGFNQEPFEANVNDNFEKMLPYFSFWDQIILKKHIINCIIRLTGKKPKAYKLY